MSDDITTFIIKNVSSLRNFLTSSFKKSNLCFFWTIIVLSLKKCIHKGSSNLLKICYIKDVMKNLLHELKTSKENLHSNNSFDDCHRRQTLIQGGAKVMSQFELPAILL